MEKEFEFKGSSVEAAIEKGLKKLNVKREDVEIEVINEDVGLFSRATVKITLKGETTVNEAQSETESEAEIEITEETPKDEAKDENIEANNETAEEKEEKRDEAVSGENTEKKYDKKGNYDKKRRENRPNYFPEEKEIGKQFLIGMTAYFSTATRIDAKSYEDEICYFISGEETHLFIGHRGETLDAIQYITGQIVNKNRENEHIRVTVDCDFYRERRKRTLTALAKKLAKDVVASGKEIALEPMNSYERRIIHAALQDSDEAETRSEGEGKDRHVVIVPIKQVMTYGNVNSDFKKKGPSKTKSFGQKRMKF